MAVTSQLERHIPKLPAAVLQSYLALLFTLLLTIFHILSLRATKANILHERPPNPPTLHFFTTPKPFIHPYAAPQLHAIRTWLSLTPRPRVTFLGSHSSYIPVAQRFNLQIRPCDETFLSVPLLPSLIAATNDTDADITVLINADIQLFDDFPYALHKLHRDLPPNWLAVAARWDVHKLPYNMSSAKSIQHARTTGELRTYGGVDMWAWDRGRPLLKTPIPPFIFGRGRYDNWLTHVAINEDSRPVVDISEAVTAVHIMHNHSLLRTTERTIEQAPDSPAAEFWSSDIRNKFELYINAYLAERHGDFRAQQGTPLHAQLKLGSCYENEGLCVLHRKRPASCRCEQAPFVRATSSDPFVVNDSRLIMCGLLSENFGTQSTKMRWHITGEQEEGRSSAFGLPLMQTDLLPMIGKDTYVVFLMVAEYADRRLVMETVCSMRAHGVFDWLLVAALDDEMYRYCAARGIAVYLSEFDESNTKSHESFRQLARYQVMHEIMRHGKDVFSLSPGIIFVDTPWAYFETLKDADMAFVGEKLGPVAGRAESSIPTPLVYGRNVSVTFQVLKNVISFMQHNSLQDGHLFVSTFCGNKNERILKNNSCRATGGANAQLFDINKVQPLDGCENCSARSKPIMYYVSGASSKSFSREEVLAVLEKHGMVRFLEDQERCSYDPPFS